MSLLAASCAASTGGRSGEGPTATASATASAEPAAATDNAPPKTAGPPMVAKLDGRDVAYGSILAKAYGKNEIILFFSNGPADCATPEKDFAARVDLNQIAKGDGTRQWTAIRGSFVSMSYNSQFGPAKVTGDASGALSIELPTIVIEASKDPKRFELSGTVAAKGCGDLMKSAAASRPQSKATLTYGKEVVPLLGAILKRDKGADELIVSAAPISCSESYVADGEDFRLELSNGQGEAYAQLRGTMIGTSISSTLHDSSRFPSLKASAPKAGVASVAVTFHAPIDGVEVQLKGTVDALVCTEQ